VGITNIITAAPSRAVPITKLLSQSACKKKWQETATMMTIKKSEPSLNHRVIPLPDRKSSTYFPKYLCFSIRLYSRSDPWRYSQAVRIMKGVAGNPGTMMPMMPRMREMVPRTM